MTLLLQIWVVLSLLFPLTLRLYAGGVLEFFLPGNVAKFINKSPLFILSLTREFSARNCYPIMNKKLIFILSAPLAASNYVSGLLFSISFSVYILNELSSLTVLPLQFVCHICLCQCRQRVGYRFLKKQVQCE